MMKKLLSLMLTVAMMASVVCTPALAATEQELQKQKEEASKKKAEAQYQVDMTQDTIEGIEAEILKANQEIDKIAGTIGQLDAEIGNLNVNLEQTTAALGDAQQRQSKQEDDFRERARVMYMYGSDGYLEVLFSATSFSDFIAKADLMRSVVTADKKALQEIEKTAREVSEKKKMIEEDKSQIEDKRGEQQEALSNQENIKAQKDQLLAKNQDKVEELQAEVNAQQAIYDQADAQLSELAAQKEQEYQDQINGGNSGGNSGGGSGDSGDSGSGGDSGNSGGDSGSGGSGGSGGGVPSTQGLIWPIDSAYYPDEWDDMFGWRIHPVFGTQSWHSGCDMGAPAGTPVWSPGDGVVTFAGWNGGYGNCVMVAVNGGTVLFGHLSSIYVSEGQWVSQGQTVGGVGTTGTSTGNHLHLSFLVNGEYVNPLNYMHW